MKCTKKLLSLLLVLAMVLSLLPAAALAADSVATIGGDNVVAQDSSDFILYYDNTNTKWESVYIYAWNDEGEITKSWPGNRMKLVDGQTSIYYAQLPGNTTKVIFNNNYGEQTEDLVVADLPGNMYDHSSKQWSNFDSNIGACTHETHGADGKCIQCGKRVDHTYVGGICACGAVEPENTDRVIYLKNDAGWDPVYAYVWTTANNSVTNHNGNWPGTPMTAVEGQTGLYSITVPSDAANIIFHNNSGVQTEDLSLEEDKDLFNNSTKVWSVYKEETPCPHNYLFVVIDPTCTKGGYTTHTCTLCGDSYNDSEVAPLGHAYADGVCTNCGRAESADMPTIQPVGMGLAFKDEIQYNAYFTVENPGNREITEMGLLTWSADVDGTIENAENVLPGAVDEGGTLKARSQPIPAKNMGDTIYMKVYLKLANGTYIYSRRLECSAKVYAANMLADKNTDAGIKALCVALLNYGAEAQTYFGYRTDDLMNADLTAEQQALVSGYSPEMIPDLIKAETDIIRTGGFAKTTVSVNFGGSLGINYIFKPSRAMDGELKLYVWTSAEEALTLENADQVLTMTERGDRYTARVGQISARNAGETIYACGVYESDGVQYTTGLLSYSIATYCKTFANSDSVFQPMAASAAVYTYYANACFQAAPERPEPPSASGTYIVGEDELPYSDEEIYQQLFDPNTKLEFDLDMSDAELQKLQDDYVRYRDMGSKSPIYRLSNMTITMTTEQGTVSYVIKEVGVRMKGNTSRTSFYNENDGIYKYIHFKFDFQETFDDEDYYGTDFMVWDSEEARDGRKDRTFATLEKLEMRWNKLYDSTYLKESYAYEVFRSEGVLAPQCNIGVLDWSGARMGIYTVEEPVDKVFIERYVSEEDAGGDLYKLGWTNEGATFTNTNSIGVEDEDKAKFYVYDLKTNKKKSTHEDLINLINTLNSGSVTKESFASVVDVDNFLRFAAVSYFMGNPDDLRNNYNNCYVYFLKSSGKAVFIPYDYDRCLGVNREYNPNGNSMTKDNPYGEGNQQSPLFRYSVDKGGFYTAEYTEVLLEVAENELLTTDAFTRRFAVAESMYADQVTPERNLKNAEGRDFSFDLNRSGSASGGSNMSFADYIDAKMTAFREYMGQHGESGGKCYIRGDFNGWAIDSGFVMEQRGDLLAFTLDFDQKISFKVYDDGDGSWMGEECLSTDTTLAWDTDGHGNIILNAGTYLVWYDPASKQITITK